MTDATVLTLGAERERRRILGIILKEYALHRLAGDERIAGVLDALATAIEHDHREDNER
jgi:hypothetical protein